MGRTRTLPQTLLNAGFASWNALAIRVGVHRSVLSHVRAGRQHMSPDLRDRVAAALGIPIGVSWSSSFAGSATRERQSTCDAFAPRHSRRSGPVVPTRWRFSTPTTHWRPLRRQTLLRPSR